MGEHINQLGKFLGGKGRESDFNLRRVWEHVPKIERLVDDIYPNSSLHFEFKSKSINKSYLTLVMDEGRKPCLIEQPEVYAAAQTGCGDFPINGDGTGPAVFGLYVNNGNINGHLNAFISNVGGFTAPTTGGVNVPISGYYVVQYSMEFGGVVVSNAAAAELALTHNGANVATQSYSVGNGFSPPLSGAFGSFNITANMYCAAGDNVGGSVSETGIAFWTPSNLCGIFGGANLTVILAGAA